LDTLLNRFSRWFTLAVVLIAVGAGAWWWSEDLGRAIRAFTAVLIVACPCALALSAPFAFGTAQRLLARLHIFVRNSRVLEAIVRIRSVVFDKTGTLTKRGEANVSWEGRPLSDEEAGWVQAAASGSTHPQATRIASFLKLRASDFVATGRLSERARWQACAPTRFEESPGKGLRAEVDGREIRLGSADWLHETGVNWSENGDTVPGAVHLAVQSQYRGRFQVSGHLRENISGMVASLSGWQRLVLLSGDSDRERPAFETLMGEGADLRFRQTPEDKLRAIADLQEETGSAMMVGDGLNDAGALRQSDVGVAVVDEVGAFSPASDVIMEASRVPALHQLFQFARRSVGVVWFCILISLLYNVVGITFAASGKLSPIVCAILMPLSSITVVTAACLGVGWAARRTGLVRHPAEEVGR
jgi:Cu+-exporting ATPase